MSDVIEKRTVNTKIAAILIRIICPERADWSVKAAQSLLNLGFATEDTDRFHRLLARYYGDQLTEIEQIELDSYMLVNCFFALIHERANRSLEKASNTLSE